MRRHLIAALVFAGVSVTASGDAGISNEARASHLLLRGNHDFAKQEYSNAEIEYRSVLQIIPQDPTAIQQLGIIYAEQGRLAKAYKYLQSAVLHEPENDTVQLKLGVTFLAVGGYAEARHIATRILEGQPNNEQALLLLIDATRTPQEIAETQQQIEALRQRGANGAECHLALGMLYLRQQDISNAEDELRKALELNPKSGPAQFALGNIHWMRNELKEADRFLRAAADLAPLRSPWRLRYADFQHLTGTPGAANKSLAEIIQKTPDYLPAWIEMMNVVCQERRDPDCADIIEKILVQDPMNYDALLARANLKLTKRKVLEALNELEQIRALYNRVPDVYYRLALAEMASGNADAALRSLTQAIDLDPNFDDAILLRDDINIARGDLASAIASLTQVITRRPDRINAHLRLAGAYLKQKNSDQVLAVYHRIKELFPQDPQPPFLIGMMFVRQNQIEDARMAFEGSLRVAPAYLPALEQLVKLDLAEDRVAAATDRVRGKIALHPGDAGLFCLRAKIEMVQRDFAGAQTALLRAIDLDSNLEAAHLLLAASYVAERKYREALLELIPFATKSKSTTALMQIGMIQAELKEFDAARGTYERLLAIDPNFGAALNNLASIYSERLPRLDKAYQLAERARRLHPDDPYIADTLGWIYFKKGLYHSAVALLEQSVAKLSAEPEPQFHLGMALLMVGKKEAATLALQHAAQSDRDFPDKEEARRKLDQLTQEPGRVE